MGLEQQGAIGAGVERFPRLDSWGLQARTDGYQQSQKMGGLAGAP